MNISALSLSLLPSPSYDPASSLLNILNGRASSGAVGGNPITALQTALKSQTKGVAAAADEPQAKRDIAAFQAAVASAKTPAELLANPQARKVLLTANGLGDQSDYVALASKALLSDTSKSGSLAEKLPNTQWLSVAKTYDFANKGLDVLKTPSVIAAITDGYAEVQWRTGLDQTTPGLSKALDFRERAGQIKNAVDILGDATLRDVVTTALGIPLQIAFQSLDAQQKAITDRLDVSQFQKPAFVEQFTRRYLIAKGAQASDGSGGATGLASLFA